MIIYVVIFRRINTTALHSSVPQFRTIRAILHQASHLPLSVFLEFFDYIYYIYGYLVCLQQPRKAQFVKPNRGTGGGVLT